MTSTMQTRLPLTGGKTIALLATGGTIAGVSNAKEAAGYKAASLDVQALLQALPADFAAPPAVLRSEQVAQLDSKDMHNAAWQALALRCRQLLHEPGVDGIVITHGTDTMEETAWFLHRMLARAHKPVIVLGAMHPADHPQADGPRNLADALALAQLDWQALHRVGYEAAGVWVLHSGTVHSARFVQKIHPWQLQAFASVQGQALGRVQGSTFTPDALAMPSWQAAAQTAGSHAGLLEALAATGQDWPWPKVAVLASHAGAEGDLARHLAMAGYRGVVIQATGNGSVHQALMQGLAAAKAQGVRVVVTTRCAQGRVALPNQPAGHDWVSAFTDLPAWKARIDLVLDLMATGD